MNITSIRWGEALALPAYTYGTASGALSAAAGYAAAHPPGSFTFHPTDGISLSPEWTRNFYEGSTLSRLQPILAGVSALVHGVRGGFELAEGLRESNGRKQLAGALDLGIAATSALSLASPGIGGAATLGLVAARAVLAVV
ncbi:MAG: hypothetical protein AB1758_07115 [Candidatus Eremiobacterota bacterium]